MRRLLPRLALIALLLPSTPTHSAAIVTKGEIYRSEHAIPNHYIVALKSDGEASQLEASQVRAVTLEDSARAMGSEYGGDVRYVYEHVVRGFSVEMDEAAALALSQDPRVAYVEEDSEVEGAGIQTNAPPGLDRIDQRDLPLDTVYSYPNSGANAHVYVIDSGIRTTHTEFGGRATADYDGVGDGQNGQDCFGHGTHVAGLVGGSTFGVAKGVRLHAVRVLNCNNTGPVSQVIAGIDWVASHHASASAALLSISTGPSPTLDNAVRGLITSGVTAVVAAGNLNLDAGTRSPARVTEAITVGYVDQFDGRGSLSNFGSVLDLFAPGNNIESANWFDDTATSQRTGTSMAAAFTAGAAALYLHVNPSATPAAVAAALNSFASANKVTNPGTGSPNLLLFRPSGTGGNGKVAFTRDNDVWTMNADGTNQVNLTNGFFLDNPYYRYGGCTSPTWSPDGTRIAFALQVDEDGRYIYTMNADGTNLTSINADDGTSSPAWSPDGTRIEFQKYGSICTMNTNGSNQSCLSTPGSGASWSPDGTRFAFQSGATGDVEIYLMNVDGTNVQRITNSAGADFSPEWSPDGRQIVFQSQRNGNDEIYVMNANGTGQTRLTNNTDYDSAPSWSPDGTQITYGSYAGGVPRIFTMKPDGRNQTNITSGPSDGEPTWQSITPSRIAFESSYTGNAEVYTMRADGSNQINLTNNAEGDYSQKWQSRIGSRILFISTRDGNYDIYTMNVDGTNIVNLSNNSAYNDNASWSADGTKVGFVSDVGGSGFDVWVMNADGTGAHALNTNAGIDDVFPWTWSADGSRIAFESIANGDGEIWAVNVDGTGLVNLTNNPGYDYGPVWSPDGSKIAFMSYRDGNAEAYVMNANGTGQTRLTNNTADEFGLAWSPNGRKLAFMSVRDGNWEIYSMNANGSEQTRLTYSSPAQDLGAQWSKDGSRIVFYSQRSGNNEIYVMNADGTNQTRLTFNTADYSPNAWQP
jgi:Tol biopolymer transport system component